METNRSSFICSSYSSLYCSGS